MTRTMAATAFTKPSLVHRSSSLNPHQRQRKKYNTLARVHVARRLRRACVCGMCVCVCDEGWDNPVLGTVNFLKGVEAIAHAIEPWVLQEICIARSEAGRTVTVGSECWSGTQSSPVADLLLGPR